MKRVIDFPVDGSKNQKRFELLYNAVLMGGPDRRSAGIEVLRREARILGALDAVSYPAGADATKFVHDEPAREVAHGNKLVLEQADFDLLKKRLDDAPWIPKFARDVVETTDWLSAAPQLPEGEP